MDKDILTDARALYEDLADGDNDYAEEREVILGLIAEIEKWQHVAIEERCKVIMLIEKLKDIANNPTTWQSRGLSKTHSEYMEQAANELGIDYIPKIVELTEERRKAIEAAMQHWQLTHCPGCEEALTSYDPSDGIEILRNMLEGEQ